MLMKMCSGWVFLLIFLCACTRSGGGTLKKEYHYRSPAWAPTGGQFAYIKQYLEYTSKPASGNWMSDLPAKEERLLKTKFALCIATANGREKELLTFDIPTEKLPELGLPAVNSFVQWKNDTITYGFVLEGVYTTGVRVYDLRSGGDAPVEQGAQAVIDHPQGDNNLNGLELYTGGGNYGFVGYQAIYLFDHNQKKVQILVGDPLRKEKPALPRYPGE